MLDFSSTSLFDFLVKLHSSFISSYFFARSQESPCRLAERFGCLEELCSVEVRFLSQRVWEDCCWLDKDPHSTHAPWFPGSCIMEMYQALFPVTLRLLPFKVSPAYRRDKIAVFESVCKTNVEFEFTTLLLWTHRIKVCYLERFLSMLMRNRDEVQ